MDIIGKGLAIIEAQRGTLLLWMPVWLGMGIALWFLLPATPTPAVLTTVALGVVGSGVAAWLTRGWPRAILMLPVLAGVGFLDIAWSAHRVAAPVLGARLTGQVIGRVIMFDRSYRGSARLTLDRVSMPRLPPALTPARVRVTLRDSQLRLDPVPGTMAIVRATLGPPPGPSVPGGFDFRRYAWFRGLGAVGYARSAALEYAAARDQGVALRLAALRLRLGRAIRDRIKGQAGAFASAILTGDRSAIDRALLWDLRNSNLAHLLAISGLHMGMLAGFVLAALRYGLATVPWLALRLPVARVAAVAALLAGLGYMVLSGASIATQRAFVMLAVMLVALLLERRALSLRAVAMAAVLVLLWRPESLVEAGFQMSFAATSALIAVFEALRNLPVRTMGEAEQGAGWRRRVVRWLGALVLSSATAGLATAPFAAWQFHRLAAYGLLANLATVPVMGLVVMPAAVLAMLGEVVAPGSGLSLPFWRAMGDGIEWILFVAARVARLKGAVHLVPAAPWTVLATIVMGGLMLVLLRGRVRLAGMVFLVVGLALWGQARPPDILISGEGGLVGAMGATGRWLSRSRGAGFAARNWLERDGDAAAQRQAAARQPPPWLDVAPHRGIPRSWRARGDARVVLFAGKGAPAGVIGAACRPDVLVILPRMRWPPGVSHTSCRVIDRAVLAREGAVSINVGARGFGAWGFGARRFGARGFGARGFAIFTARGLAGRRAWSTGAASRPSVGKTAAPIGRKEVRSRNRHGQMDQ